MKRFQNFLLIAISGVLAIIIVLMPKWLPTARQILRELAINRTVKKAEEKIASAHSQNADDDNVGGPMTSLPPNVPI